MIRSVDDHELFRFATARVEGAHRFLGTDLVALAVYEELRLRAPRHRLEVVARHRQRDADERGDARIVGAYRQGDPRAERHAAGPHRRGRMARLHEGEPGPEILRLARA